MYYSKAISKDQYNLDTLKYESQLGHIRSKSYSKVQSTCQKLDQKRITDQAR